MPARPTIPNFFNPVASPLGASIANLANTVAAGPQQRLQMGVLAGEAADKQQSFLNAQQKFNDTNDINSGYNDLSSRIGKLGGIGPDGKPVPFTAADAAPLYAAATRAHMDPQHLADSLRGINAFNGPRDDTFVNSQLGAGQAYGTTAPAFDTTQSNEMTRAANTVTAETARNQANIAGQMARTQYEQGHEDSRAALTRDAQAPKDPVSLFNSYFKVATDAGLSPADAKQYALTNAAPRNPPTAGQPTEQQVRARGLVSELHDTSSKLDAMDGELSSAVNNALEGTKHLPLVGGSLGSAPAYFESNGYRNALQAGRQWVQNLNFIKSGQGASDAEVERQLRIYLPVAGDGPDQIKQKRDARASAMRGAEMIAAGRAPVAPVGSGAGQPQQTGGAQGDPLAQARDAISRGAPRAAVIQRLQQNGIDPAGL